MDVHVSSLLKFMAFPCGVLSCLICANSKKVKEIYLGV